jgi:lipopolysaccharide/colanic/teichoic acid biosynthesis glycosyltransferase
VEGVTAPPPEQSGLFAARPRAPQQAGFIGMMAVDYVPTRVVVAKRALDIVVATIGLIITAPLWPIIALVVKLDSPGEIFYRQIRVGRMLADHTELFEILKFRSMRHDAEKGTGAVWAQRSDPRVTRVGRFLRKTRLDELPQLLNVLYGDMSVVGPRPERPALYGRLERDVPFFADRTAGLRPGVTGMTQVRQGYDNTIDDVRRKVAYDAAYAMQLSTLRGWFVADISIMLATIRTMVTGRGAQ